MGQLTNLARNHKKESLVLLAKGVLQRVNSKRSTLKKVSHQLGTGGTQNECSKVITSDIIGNKSNVGWDSNGTVRNIKAIQRIESSKDNVNSILKTCTNHLYEERAGIIEYDGGYSQNIAEARSKEEAGKVAQFSNTIAIKEVKDNKSVYAEAITIYMNNITHSLIPNEKIEEVYIQGINDIEQLKSLDIPDISIAILPDGYVEIKRFSKSVARPRSYLSLSDYIADKKGEFIDWFDLGLYRDEETCKVNLTAQVYNKIGNAIIGVIFNKRSETHLVPKTGLFIIVKSDKYNIKKNDDAVRNCQLWDEITVSGYIRESSLGTAYVEAENLCMLNHSPLISK